MMTELGQERGFQQLGAVPEQQSCPNVIGILKAGSNTTFSFLIRGRGDSKGSKEAKILNIFLEKEARIISLAQSANVEDNGFVISLTCELKESRATPDSLLVELRKQKFVEDATVTNMKNWLFERQLFPLNISSAGRVAALNPNVLLQLEDTLNGGSAAPEDALIEAGREFVLDIARRVKGALAFDSSNKQNRVVIPDQLVRENTLACLKAMGWGVFTMQSAKSVDQVMIQHPPVSAGEDARGNHFLYGLAVGLVRAFSNHKGIVVQESYDSASRILTLTLAEVEVPVAVEPASLAHQNIGNQNEATASAVNVEEEEATAPPKSKVEEEKEEDVVEEEKRNLTTPTKATQGDDQKMSKAQKRIQKTDEQKPQAGSELLVQAEAVPMMDQQSLESMETAINSIKGKIKVENNEFVNVDEIVEEDLLST